MPNGLIDDNLFELSSLKGGLDDTTPIMAMEPDTCTTAENVEFVSSTLGERRNGCEPLASMPASFADVSLDAVTWMYRHLPTNDSGDAELWALCQSLSTGDYALARRDAIAWLDIVPDDDFDVTDNQGHRISAQTFHGKLFFAGKTAQDRLHVYDGTNLRRVGLAQPVAGPVVNNSVAGGTFSDTRYYRVRYATLSGSTVLRRSEPSDATTFSPSGINSGAVITKPAAINEHETHWEVEASLDDANFYMISRQVVGTTTYTDTTDSSTGYAVSFELSEDIGDYSLIPSGKFLTVDQDRLLIGGSWEEPSEASRVRWTPVFADPGVGNDERLALDTDPFIDLDGYEGGEITGMSRNVNGYIYVFKRNHIYKLARSGVRSAAYEAIPLTKVRGALPGSLVEAASQAGQPSLYFLDEFAGPTRLGSNGLQWCGRDIQTLWSRININAAIPCHGVYYSKKRQVHYWLAVDGSTYPNFKIVLHVNEMRDTDEGARRGWVTVSKSSRITTAHCSVAFSDNVGDVEEDRSNNLVPFIGKQSWEVSSNTIREYIQQCDTGSTDAHSTGDTASTYSAVVTSKPFALGGLLTESGVKDGALLCEAADSPDGQVYVKISRDFGKEEKTVGVSHYTPGGETKVIARLEDMGISELTVMQVSLGDLDDSVTPPDSWALDLLQLRIQSEAVA